MAPIDLSALTLEQLLAQRVALRHAVAALEDAGMGDGAIYADDDGFEGSGTGPGDRFPRERVTFTVPIPSPQPLA